MLTLIIVFLVWITQILKLIKFIDQGMSVTKFLSLALLVIPSIMFTILPIVLILSILHTYHILIYERQLLALQSAGISDFLITKPALSFAVIVTIFAYSISFYLMPLSYSYLKEVIHRFQQGNIASLIEARTFVPISNELVIYVDKKHQNNSFSGVIVFHANKSILFAQSGCIANMELTLLNGSKHDKSDVQVSFDKFIIRIGNKSAALKPKTSTELYIHEMLYPSGSLSQSERERLIVDGNLRIIWPIFCMSCVCLGLGIYMCYAYSNTVVQCIMILTPIALVLYSYSLLQKATYQNFNYIYLCYAISILPIIIGMMFFKSKHVLSRSKKIC